MLNSKNPGGRLRITRFSLIELLVAMTILVMMMGMMLYILATSQKNWKHQEGRTKLYNNSRIVFDLLERDIRSMVVSDVDGRKIGFHVYDHDSTDALKRNIACFVASTEPATGSTSRLCEIKYRFHSQQNQSDRFLLQRQQVSSVNSADWDFFNVPLTAGSEWYLNNSLSSPEFENVVGGVKRFSIQFYVQDPDTGSLILVDETNTDQYATTQPIQVIVNMELFEEEFSGSEFDNDPNLTRERRLRGFTKIFYLGHMN